MSLEHINHTDTVNVWMQKLNALIDYVNNTTGTKLIIRSNNKPTTNLFFGKLWYDTDSNTLKIFDDTVGDFINWNMFFVPEIKFLQKIISNNYTVPANKNAITISPEIDVGASVVISSGSTMVIL